MINKALNWTYDKAGNIKTKTDYQRDTTAYQYDSTNRLVAETNPAYVQVSYHYDGAGRLIDRILSNGAKTQYRYDASGRLLQLTNATVTGQTVNDTTYTRDRVGNILTTTDTQSAASYQYDPVYRLITANGGAAINVAAKAQGATASASSSLIGNSTGDFLPNGAIDGDRIHWTDPGSVAGTPAHAWADGTDGVFPDSWQVTFSGPKTIDTINVYGLEDNFVNAFEPTLATTFINFGLINFKVQYWTGTAWQTIPGGDITGNDKVWRQFSFPAITTTALQIEVSLGGTRFSRIVEVEAYARGKGSQETYTYDKVGNRKTQTAGGTTRYYNYNAGNRLTDIRTGSTTGTVFESYQYDANGSLTQISGNRNINLTWDANNRASAVSGRSYNYDPSNYRISKGGTGISLNYYLDGEHLDAVYDGGISVQSQNLRGSVIDEVVYGYQRDSNNKLVAGTSHHDALQSVLGQSDHQGTIQYRQNYTAFGTATDPSQPQRYTGREMDTESGLYYYRARYYDPITGRFISEDPLGFQAGVNFYSYCLNNPVNCNDPSGNAPLQVGGAIVGGVLGIGTQASIDLARGNFSSFSEYAGALTGGAAGGAAAVTCGPVCAGATAGAVSSATIQGINYAQGQALSALDFLTSTAAGAIGGKVANTVVPYAFKTLLPNLVGSYQANQIKGAIGEAFTLLDLVGSGRAISGTKVSNGFGKSDFDFQLLNGTFVESKFGTARLNRGSQAAAAEYYDNLGLFELQSYNYPIVSGIFGSGFVSGSTSANGGFLLYPNKTNTNQIQSVYAK